MLKTHFLSVIDVLKASASRNLQMYKENWGFPGGASGKEPTCQLKRHKRRGFNPCIGKILWRRKWQPTPVLSPEKSHGQRSLVSYSPWGRNDSDRLYSPWGQKESDMTERLLFTSLFAIRMVSSAYLRLLIFLPAILIPACASSIPAFHMM